MRYRLRTLLILMAILPPLLWLGWTKYEKWRAEQERQKALAAEQYKLKGVWFVVDAVYYQDLLASYEQAARDTGGQPSLARSEEKKRRRGPGQRSDDQHRFGSRYVPQKRDGQHTSGSSRDEVDRVEQPELAGVGFENGGDHNTAEKERHEECAEEQNLNELA